jgi:hypothetical protein
VPDAVALVGEGSMLAVGLEDLAVPAGLTAVETAPAIEPA